MNENILSVEDEDAANTLFRQLIEAWNARDASAYAGLFTERGNVVGFDGSQLDGRASIQSELEAVFRDHKTAAYLAKVREVRALGPNTILLRAAAGMVCEGASDINPAVNAVQTLVAQKDSGTWRIALFQNTPAQFHGRPELAQALSEELRQLRRKQRR